jgi:hypothetical protein
VPLEASCIMLNSYALREWNKISARFGRIRALEDASVQIKMEETQCDFRLNFV